MLGLNLSPAQLMFNRRLRTKIPISEKLLNTVIFNNVNEKIKDNQSKAKYYYRGSKELPIIRVGEFVTMYNFINKSWEAKVIRCNRNRSYTTVTIRNKKVIKNRIHLRKSETAKKEFIKNFIHKE